MGVFPLHCAHRRGTMSGVPLTVVDNPPDRPEWIKETIRLLTGSSADGPRSLLHLVEQTTDADLLAGTVDEWGLGQIAFHLLIVDRGASLVASRLARGGDPVPSGQPRPCPYASNSEGAA